MFYFIYLFIYLFFVFGKPLKMKENITTWYQDKWKKITRLEAKCAKIWNKQNLQFFAGSQNGKSVQVAKIVIFRRP